MSDSAGFWRSGRKVLLEHLSLLWVALSALLLTLSLPPYSNSLLSWIALTPLIYVLDKRSEVEGFWLGFYFGVILWLLTAYWAFIYHAVALPGVVIIMALYTAFLGACYCYLQKKLPKWPRILIDRKSVG